MSIETGGASAYSGTSPSFAFTEATDSGAGSVIVATGLLFFAARGLSLLTSVLSLGDACGLSFTRTYPPRATSTVSILNRPMSVDEATSASESQRCRNERYMTTVMSSARLIGMPSELNRRYPCWNPSYTFLPSMDSTKAPRGSMPCSRMSNSVGIEDISESNGEALRRPRSYSLPSCSRVTWYLAPLPPSYLGIYRLTWFPRTLILGLPRTKPDSSISEAGCSAASTRRGCALALDSGFFPRKNSSKLISEMSLPAMLSLVHIRAHS